MRNSIIGLFATAFALLSLVPGSALGAADPLKPLISNASDVGVDYAPKCTNLRANGGRCFWWGLSTTVNTSSATFALRGRTKVCADATTTATLQVYEVITPTVSIAPTAATLDGTDCLFLYAGVYWFQVSSVGSSGNIVVSLVEDLD